MFAQLDQLRERVTLLHVKMVKVKLSLEQAMKAQRGSTGITLLFL